MATKIIVSYDGTANEDDAIALGRMLRAAGAEVGLAYVRHAREAAPERESLALAEAEELLRRGTSILGDPDAPSWVVTDRSTPEGLGALAASEGADVIVFCSDSHTARGHVTIGNSAERLLIGGTTAIAIAPVDVALTVGTEGIRNIVAIGDGDGGARRTAESLAAALGGEVRPVVGEQTDLLVIDSRPEAEEGRIAISSSAEHLIEIATCPVLVLPRGRALEFEASAATAA
jgi:nucleotide-binding universal stress UspA family protein